MLELFKILDINQKGTLSGEDIAQAYEKVIGYVSP